MAFKNCIQVDFFSVLFRFRCWVILYTGVKNRPVSLTVSWNQLLYTIQVEVMQASHSDLLSIEKTHSNQLSHIFFFFFWSYRLTLATSPLSTARRNFFSSKVRTPISRWGRADLSASVIPWMLWLWKRKQGEKKTRLKVLKDHDRLARSFVQWTINPELIIPYLLIIIISMILYISPS